MQTPSVYYLPASEQPPSHICKGITLPSLEINGSPDKSLAHSLPCSKARSPRKVELSVHSRDRVGRGSSPRLMGLFLQLLETHRQHNCHRKSMFIQKQNFVLGGGRYVHDNLNMYQI